MNEHNEESALPKTSDYFNRPYPYSTKEGGMKVINVHSGEYHVTDGSNEMMVTILGSCIATCLHDPVAKISAMNHFLLPGDLDTPPSPKYGIFAMEYMINELLKRGGLKSRINAKIFGGGRVMKNYSAGIGDNNIKFVKEYLQDEGIKLTASDVGGDFPRRINFYGDNGKVMVRKLGHNNYESKVIKEESAFIDQLAHLKQKPSVELFGG